MLSMDESVPVISNDEMSELMQCSEPSVEIPKDVFVGKCKCPRKCHNPAPSPPTPQTPLIPGRNVEMLPRRFYFEEPGDKEGWKIKRLFTDSEKRVMQPASDFAEFDAILQSIPDRGV